MQHKKPVIDVLSSLHQQLSGARFMLGMDAELLPSRGTHMLWPHVQKCPQERGSALWRVPGLLPEGDWHGDGYAFEVCVEPSTCINTLLHSLGKTFQFLTNKYKSDLAMKLPTIYEVPTRVVASAPPDVKRLGCAPSFNVYDDPGDPTSLGPAERTTGCHFHISHRWLTNERAKVSVKWADILVGNAWNYISPEDPSQEAQRRKAYGRAGEHRRNIYPNRMFGFEYRVLPGMALAHPAYVSLMFNLLRSSVHMAAKHGEPTPLLSATARSAINKADKPLSKAILDEMPFTATSRRVLNFMAKKPLAPLSLKKWSAMGSKGHVDLALHHVHNLF